MYRGIAEGITHGAVNYTDFPAVVPVPGARLFLGRRARAGADFHCRRDRLRGAAPSFRNRTRPLCDRLRRVRRALRGHSGRAKRVGLVYLLSGLVSSLAAIIYVAHLGQAKSSAGMGYELDAITAVVLGGTSVFGGRGTLWGTLFGLFFLSVLQNGLHLAALPSELTGVLTGVLLVSIISFDRWRLRRATMRFRMLRRMMK